MQKEIVEFVGGRYPGYAFILFYGSAANGTANELSDVDIMVVYHKAIRPFREKIRHNGRLLDVWVYDVESVNSLIHSARRGVNIAILDMVGEAIVLPEETRESALLKVAADRVRALPPLVQDVASMRHYITSCLDDLRSAATPEVGKMIAVELFQAVSSSILTIIGSGGSKKKHAVKALADYDRKFFDALMASLEAAVAGDLEKIQACALEFLAQIGGECRDGYSSPVPEVQRMPLPVI